MIRLNFRKKNTGSGSPQPGVNPVAVGLMLLYLGFFLYQNGYLVSAQGVIFLLGFFLFLGFCRFMLRFDYSKEITEDQALGGIKFAIGALLLMAFIHYIFRF